MARRLIAILTIASLTWGVPALAALDETAEEPKAPTPESEGVLSFWFDDETGLLVFGPSDPDAMEPLDCTPEDGSLEVGEDGSVIGEAPEGCIATVVEGGDNGVSHGEVVSHTVHALKEIRAELDAPFGHYVREIATSDLGKKNDEDESSTEPETSVEDPGDDADGPPDHAQARGHDKKTEESPETETARGNGPPAHAPAHGRDK